MNCTENKAPCKVFQIQVKLILREQQKIGGTGYTEPYIQAHLKKNTHTQKHLIALKGNGKKSINSPFNMGQGVINVIQENKDLLQFRGGNKHSRGYQELFQGRERNHLKWAQKDHILSGKDGMRQIPNKAQPVQRCGSRPEKHMPQGKQVSSLAKRNTN